MKKANFNITMCMCTYNLNPPNIDALKSENKFFLVLFVLTYLFYSGAQFFIQINCSGQSYPEPADQTNSSAKGRI
jgi:hypothetical protein